MSACHHAVEITSRLECIHRKDREPKKLRGFGGFSSSNSGGKGRHGGDYVIRQVQSTIQVSSSAPASHGLQSTRTGYSSFSALPARVSYSGYSNRLGQTPFQQPRS